MNGNSDIDLNKIALECGLDKTLDPQIVLHNIAELEEFYEKDDLIEIYKYLLNTIPNPEYLIQIVRCCDSYKNKDVLPVVIAILQKSVSIDDDEAIDLRVICAKSIAKYQDSSCVNILLDCMSNKKEHYKVRLACADALGKIGDKFAVTPLINVVKDEDEKSIYLKESATKALGIIGDDSAIEPLISILDTRTGIFSKFSFLKEKIIEALDKLNFNNEKIFSALKKSLFDESTMVRINAIEAIMNTEDYRAIDCIKPCLTDPDDEVKKNALIALYNLSDRTILDEVIENNDYSEYLKNVAQEIIDEYEDCEDEDE